MEDISRPKKGKTKKKLKLFRALTVILAILLVAVSAYTVYSAVSAGSEIEDLKSQLNDMRNDLTTMTNENVSLENQVSQLTSKNDDLSRKYDQLNSDTATFQATITDLQTQVSQLNTEKDSLQTELDSVTKQLSTVKNTNSSLTDKNKSLSNQISTLNSTVTTLKNENKALRDTIEGLGQTVPEEGGTDESDDKLTEENTSTSTESSGKIAYLTFDDGVSKYTNDILDILAKYNVKATFFPNWRSGITDYQAKYKRMVDEGHAIGNHTYSHEYKDVYSSLDGFISEVTKLNDKIEDLTGYRPTIFRFPGGSNNTVHKSYNTNIIQPAISALADMGMEYYDWNVDSGDAASSKGASKDTIVKNVLSGATYKKIVILMHDTNTKGTTVQALPEIIEGLIEKGYSFGVLTDGSAPVVQYVKPKN